MMTVWHGDKFTIGRRHRDSQVAVAVMNPSANVGDIRGVDSIPGLRRSPGGEHGNPLKCSCLENPHGHRSLEGYSPWACTESDTTEHAHMHETCVW